MGNIITSLIDALSVNSMTSLSMPIPIPIPPVGAIPYSRAVLIFTDKGIIIESDKLEFVRQYERLV